MQDVFTLLGFQGASNRTRWLIQLVMVFKIYYELYNWLPQSWFVVIDLIFLYVPKQFFKQCYATLAAYIGLQLHFLGNIQLSTLTL